MDTQRNSHGTIYSDMLTVAWRDWKKWTKLQSAQIWTKHFPDKTSVKSWVNIQYMTVWNLLLPGTESLMQSKCTNTVHWVQCSFWNKLLTSVNITSLTNGHVSLTSSKPKSKICTNNFVTQCSSTLHTHTFSQVAIDKEHLSGTDAILGYDIAQQDNMAICSKCFEVLVECSGPRRLWQHVLWNVEIFWYVITEDWNC
jgi:hypothetical protein